MWLRPASLGMPRMHFHQTAVLEVDLADGRSEELETFIPTLAPRISPARMVLRSDSSPGPGCISVPPPGKLPPIEAVRIPERFASYASMEFISDTIFRFHRLDRVV